VVVVGSRHGGRFVQLTVTWRYHVVIVVVGERRRGGGRSVMVLCGDGS
jgi:hypothetical protein